MNVAIIGSGGIGMRHLQAIAQISGSVRIYVVDVSPESLERARSAYEEVPHTCVDSISFLKRISDMPRSIDVAIVATSSMPRRQAVEELLNYCSVSYLVLEKILFPQITDYFEMAELFDRKAVKVWVNCPRRMSGFYENLRSIFDNEVIERFTVTGTGWGLACNGIHFIDLMAFLLRDYENFQFDPSALDEGHAENKRRGYIEFNGTLNGSSRRCPVISIACGKGDVSPVSAKLEGPNIVCEIEESTGTVRIMRSDSNWKPEVRKFSLLYQSQLSGTLALQLMDTGTCSLTSYDESAKLHIPILNAFLQHLNKDNKEKERITVCPIT